MNRSKKLGLLAAVLAVLVVGTLLVTRLEADSTTEAEDTAVTVFSLDSGTVTSLSWTYGDETLSFALDGEDWSYEADSAFPVNPEPLNAMVATLSQIDADKTIENPESLSDYGLLEPACTITVEAGEETTILVGDETELGSYRYLSIGDGSVYLVSDTILEDFSYGLLDLVELETIPDMDTVETFTLTTADHEWTLEYLENSGLAYSDSYVWFLRQEDGYTTLDTELTETFIGNITGISWLSCVDYQGSENLSLYGLDDPAAEVSVTYLDEDDSEAAFTVELSGSYARIAGSDRIYIVDSTILDTMEYTTETELLPDDILLLDEDKLESVDVTLDGTTYSITREVRQVETESEDSTEEPETTEETVYTMEGEEISFESVLETLEYLTASGTAVGAEAGQEEISFVFHMDSEEYPQITLTFGRYNSTDCLVTLNGETRLLVSRESVVALAEQFQVLVLS